MESLATAASGAELFLETAGVCLGLGIFVARTIHCGIGQAHDHAPDCSQHARCLWSAHPALILAQRDVQAMVHPAFDDPIAALEREHPAGLQLIEAQAAQQVDHLAAPFAFAPDPGFEPGGQPSSGKAHLTGRDFHALQRADLQAPPVAFPAHHPGPRRGPWGKRHALQTCLGVFFGRSAGWP